MNLMKPTSHALRAAFLLAALTAFSAASYAADSPKPQDSSAPKQETALHEIGAADATVTPEPAPVLIEEQKQHHGDGDDFNRVSVSDETVVAPNETVPGNAVSVFGPLTVKGTVNGNAVSVFGGNKITGTVHGNAVVVFGALRLGPNAHVDGNVVAVAGVVVKDPGAYVGGNFVQQNTGLDFSKDSAASSWWQHGARMGRPIAFGPHLHTQWLFIVCQLALYVLLCLAFPGGATKCGDTLVQRPGITLLTGILAIVALPVIFILLLVTVVGIPVALVVLPLMVLTSIVFGKASIYSHIGRSILGKQQHPALTALVGAVVATLLYLIPYVGIVLWIVVSFLGFACALTTLLTPSRKAPAAAVPPIAPAPPTPLPQDGMPLVAEPPVAAPSLQPAVPLSGGQPAALLAPLPPPLSAPPASGLGLAQEAALPRAGFWIRMVALLIDLVLIGIVTQKCHYILVILGAYGAFLWKFRGATIGGIIFHIKVVRLDARPVDWVTAIVRALA
jgi:uncharacterized RDD family membrane protein YckC